MTEYESKTRPNILNEDNHRQYLLRSKAQIRSSISEIIKNRANVTVFFTDNNLSCLSSIVDIDDERLILDIASDPAINAAIELSKKTYVDVKVGGVRQQFVLGPGTPTEFNNYPSLRFSLPEKLIRLQRREAFRLLIPRTEKLKCQLPLPHLNGKLIMVDSRPLNLSIKGVGVILELDKSSLASINRGKLCIGLKLEKVLFHFGDGHAFEAALEVRNIIENNGGINVASILIGLQFITIPQREEIYLQRYLMQLQKSQLIR